VTVQWAPQASVGAYQLVVNQIVINGGNVSAVVAAILSTGDHQITIPADLLTKGAFYNLELVASHQNAVTDYADGKLRETSFPSGSVTLFSGLFRFSSDCGDGVTGSDEECDTGSDSATCDADCTMALCGDGYVNTAAGEQCDNVFDSATCNANCTTPVCGDGYVNAAAGEQCDDGNTTPGDGCSASCQIEPGFVCQPGSPSACHPPCAGSAGCTTGNERVCDTTSGLCVQCLQPTDCGSAGDLQGCIPETGQCSCEQDSDCQYSGTCDIPNETCLNE
jgi:cysteine-rich repeat protein